MEAVEQIHKREIQKTIDEYGWFTTDRAGGGRRRRRRMRMRRMRRRRARENPGFISDAAIPPPAPCPLLISPYEYVLHTSTRALERQAPHGPDRRPMGLTGAP